MPRLLVMRGLPGSGKSTWAAAELKRDGNAVRVNRDDLRAMLHKGLPWSGGRERSVKRAQKAIIRALLGTGKTVIVDDTNLLGTGIDHWRDFLEEENRINKCFAEQCFEESMPYKLDVMDLTDVPMAECVRRDAERESPARVGRGVIERMALESGLIDFRNETKVAIVDIDGTLADLDHRLHHIQKTPKDWSGFFGEVSNDSVFAPVFHAVMNLKKSGYTIINVSGRPTSVGHATNKWLQRHHIPSDYLFMRRSGDHRPDVEVKEELLNLLFNTGLSLSKDAIKIVLDDRESVCEMWRRYALPLVQVDHGNAVRIEPSALEVTFTMWPIYIGAGRCAAPGLFDVEVRSRCREGKDDAK